MTVTIRGKDETERGREKDEGVKGKSVRLYPCREKQQSVWLCIFAVVFFAHPCFGH